MRLLSKIWFGCVLAGMLIMLQPRSSFANAEGAQLFFSPSAGTNVVGSTFDVSVMLNTNGHSVSAIQLDIKYSPDKLRIVKPSADQSLLAIWLEPPVYSNTDGTAHLVGVIPNGIKTDSGLISTITFEAIASGQATIEVQSSSSVLANDGIGTELLSGLGRATFSLTPKPPEGVSVYSDTHSFSDQWYNNSTVSFTLDKSAGAEDFSYEFDNKPFTVPDNESETSESIVQFNDVADGVWYFHVKARREGVWGTPSHLLVRVDTQAPAKFKPTSEVLFSGEQAKAFVSFFTTDALSGIDHYEVGVLEAGQPADQSPVFIRAESPYQLPDLLGKNFRVIVRAFDKAGNVTDETITVTIGTSIVGLVKQNIFIILGVLLALAILYFILHLHLRNRIARYREAMRLMKEEEHLREEMGHHHEHVHGSLTNDVDDAK
jgi:hypothetical protein